MNPDTMFERWWDSVLAQIAAGTNYLSFDAAAKDIAAQRGLTYSEGVEEVRKLCYTTWIELHAAL